MALIQDHERERLEAIGALNYTNPFEPERLRLEGRILGNDGQSAGPVWNMHTATRPEVSRIARLAEEWSDRLHRRMQDTAVAVDRREHEIYEAVVFYRLFEKYRQPMSQAMLTAPDETCFPCYRDFLADYRHYFGNRRGRELPQAYTPEKTFAVYYQIHRAFYHIFDFIAGSSLAAGRLRAAIWQSIFTCDLYRYHRVLFDRMNGLTTLITGESGTGKELAAQAVALSQYIPFDAAELRFRHPYRSCFLPIQLSAMPRTMIESELFGHRKGAYTGALNDRKGYLEECSPSGSVFLDEIGEIDAEIQVKLLRVLQSRQFQRLGDTAGRSFHGKIIAATNRNLRDACVAGEFRDDLYYRLCADTVTTVPLRELVNGEAAELERFVRLLSERLLGAEEAERFTAEAMQWIDRHLGWRYPWPGNVRELEQCVRNLLIRGHYEPAAPAGSPAGAWDEIIRAQPNAETVTRDYLLALYRQTPNLAQVARIAALDRRTVRKFLEL